MKKEVKLLEKENYIAPDIEVVEIETEQNILDGGSDGRGDLSGADMNNEEW